MAKIGLVPGQPFDLTKLAPDVQKALADVGKSAYAVMEEEQKKGGKTVNGWLVTTGTGAYGKNYLWRAAVSAYGWGANLQEDAVYPSTKVDADGNTLVGTNTYIVHFAKGQTPPVDGFWSITMYDSEYYFYPNPLNKLTVSPLVIPPILSPRPINKGQRLRSLASSFSPPPPNSQNVPLVALAAAGLAG